MRTWIFGIAGLSATLALAACDDSSVSTAGQTFQFDGGTYQGPEGGSPTPPPGSPDGGAEAGIDAGPTVPCVATLTGAVSKTLSCTVIGAYSVKDGKGGVSVSVGNELQLAFTVGTELAAGTYGWPETLESGGTLIENLTNVWLASKADSVGASQFVLTSASVTFANADGKAYAPHGTATATMKAQNDAGGGGDVTVSVTF